MTYAQRDDVPVDAGETAYQLDTGEIVAVRVTRSVAGAVVHYHAHARAIDTDGAPVRDAAGSPVIRELRHQARGAALLEPTTLDCTRAVLGEPPLMVRWGADLLADVSIREAIALAPLAG